MAGLKLPVIQTARNKIHFLAIWKSN